MAMQLQGKTAGLRRIWKGSQRGTSLVELAMVISVMGFVIAIVLYFTNKSKSSLTDFENKSELIRYTQRISTNLRETLKSNSMLLVNTPVQALTGYHTLMNNSMQASTSGAPPVAAFSVTLTAMDSTGMLPSDPAAAGSFGNRLDLVCSIAPEKVYYDSAGGTAYMDPSALPGGAVVEEVQVNRHQFVSLYLGEAPQNIGSLGLPRLEVVEWRSLPVLSYDSLSWMSGAKLDAVTAALGTGGYLLAWQNAAPNTASAFYTVDPGGGLDPTGAPAQLGERSWAYVRDFNRVMEYHTGLEPMGRMASAASSAGVSGFSSSYSIAYNTGEGLVPGAAVKQLFVRGGEARVPRFAAAAVNGATGGFEVLVVGNAGVDSRMIYCNITMMASSAGSPNPTEHIYSGAAALAVVTVSNPY